VVANKALVQLASRWTIAEGTKRRVVSRLESSPGADVLPTIDCRSRERHRVPSTAPDDRIYAIGDIHGCYDLWLALLTKIEDHARSLPPGPRPQLILMGDMIDRGPASAKVLKLAYEAQRQNSDLLVLLGNHEMMMLDAVDGRRGAMAAWLRFGGRETLGSLGIDPPEGDFTSKEYATALRAAIPAEWLSWLRRLPLSMRSGDYYFCHAGIRPGLALKRQSPTDLLWIREEFVDDAGEHGLVVVHGHSISRTVEIRHNRIGIDTGAYASGELSAVYLEGTRRELISTTLSDPIALPQTLGCFID
jgi:serine/threonine protein phosphatase 1